ncbi:LuxR C-terminal-related transcriptional regulator [Brevibacillus choshinensis]|uniref:Helix-turn-helix transcriptional regulator n=1 Tax=Brevibacillus choshinensis TaxID=54911 RepID=A0ABX7FPZ1_BRECH|nr:LuxR C-terminal-related transcriptional regulator [Brevibacillus choshinensis]QRG68313.1 helix-turn-helix transcriptional regulator [Brevibacillus choshinensis]
MVSTTTFQEQMQKLEAVSSHEEQLYMILQIYLELFPVRNAYLMRYSPLGHLAEGIISLQATGMVHIGEIREDVRSYPIIFTAIRERQAKFCTGIDYLKQMSTKDIMPSSIHSMLVVPICSGPVVVGYICSSDFDPLPFDESLLPSMTMYGKQVGRLMLGSAGADNEQHVLSKRELEVMRRIAWGENTKEMADSIKISEFTVKQYVKSAIKKLGAQNRSHAIGELYRRGYM